MNRSEHGDLTLHQYIDAPVLEILQAISYRVFSSIQLLQIHASGDIINVLGLDTMIAHIVYHVLSRADHEGFQGLQVVQRSLVLRLFDGLQLLQNRVVVRLHFKSFLLPYFLLNLV